MENSQKTQHKGVVALGVTVAALVLAILGLIMAYYFQADHATDLQHQVTDLKASVAEKEKAIANAMAVTKPATQVQYREIPELGVKYKVTEQTKDLTYSFRSNEDGTIRVADFSTVAISAMKGTGIDKFPCVSSEAPSGSFALYMNGNQMIQGRMVKDLGKKVGNFYFVYSHPQYACSLTPNTPPGVEGLEESIAAVKAAYDSLEAM